MPTPAQTVDKKWSKPGRSPVGTFTRWLGGLEDPAPQAKAVVAKVDSRVRDALKKGGSAAVVLWELQVDAVARELLGRKHRIVPQGVRVHAGGLVQAVKPKKGATAEDIRLRPAKSLAAGKLKKPPTVPARPPALFPADKDRPKPWQIKPTSAAVSAGTTGTSSGKIKRIPMLEKLPAKLGGPAWKKFFARNAGRDLDAATNIVELGDAFYPAFLAGERIDGPKASGWTMVYRITDAPGGELALDAHALHNDAYVASWYVVIAPREPLEKDDMALKMVTASAIDGARRALTVIAKQYGTSLPTSRESFKPTPRAYHAQIAKKHGADLRGAPLYAEVDWSHSAAVSPNDDFFGAF